MSYQQRRALASLISTILIGAFYFWYVTTRYPTADAYSAEVFHFWGTSIVILIPVSIAVQIAIHIQFSIVTTIATRQKESYLTDERDKLIELKAVRNSSYVFAAGFFLAMGSLVMNMPPSVMFIVLIVSGSAAGLVAALSELYFYRRGF